MKTSQKTGHYKATDYAFAAERTVHWMGGVTNGNYLDTMDELKEILKEDPREPVHVVVTSAGGATGIAMSFYDSIRRVYRPTLYTIGSGDVDSSGIIVFLAGEKRFITPNTTMLLHLAGRVFEHPRRFTVPEMESMIKEDKLKDFQYASVVAENSGGRLSTERVLDMMAANTILSSYEAVELGLAHHVLE